MFYLLFMTDRKKFFGSDVVPVSPATGRPLSILFHLRDSLGKLVEAEGPDVTLWRALIGQILEGFISSSVAYSLQTDQGQIFDFVFIPANELSRYGAIQVTERISSDRSRVVWRVPFIMPVILNKGLTVEASSVIYSIDDQDEVLLRHLFRKEQAAQRAMTHKVLTFFDSNTAEAL